MKTAGAQLLALLASGGPFFQADLYTIKFQSGSIVYWTSADTQLTLNSQLFSPLSLDNGTDVPLIHRGDVRLSRGLEVPTMDLTLMSGQGVAISGVPLPLFAHNGGFDWARVKLERVVMPSWGDTSPGSIILFEAGVAGVDPSTTQVVLHLKGDLEKLTRMMPRVVFSPGCQNNFGDIACGISIAGLAQSGIVGPSSTTTVLNLAPAAADGYFTMGTLAMTSGACSGSRRAVRLHASGVISLATPLPSVPAPGDTYSVTPGCDRTMAGCASRSNSNNFRGCPFVPPAVTTL